MAKTNYELGQELLRGDYTAYTPSGKSYFKKAGKYGKAPTVGAFIYFYKADRGDVGHVGIVTSVRYAGGKYTISTVEGNTNADAYNRDGGKVAVKSYTFTSEEVGGGNRIDGFGYPAFGAATCSADDLITVALSQVGYVEKASNRELDDFDANPGDENYTKYGRWAKECGWGYNPAQWCAMFASWCAFVAVCTAHAYRPTGWILQDDKSWSYKKPDGEFCRDEWLFHGGRWYVFDGAGRMITGWFRQGTDWYYLAGDGGMISSQWLTEDDHSYYFTASGIMARSAYVASTRPAGPGGGLIYYWVDAEGHYCPDWDTAEPYTDLFEIVT